MDFLETLETEVDEKYYVKPEKAIKLLKEIFKGKEKSQGERIYNVYGHSITLSSCGGGLGAKTGLYLMDMNEGAKITETCRTIRTRYNSGITSIKAMSSGVLSVKALLTPERINKRQNGRRIKEEGEPMFTLTEQDRHGILITWNDGENLLCSVRRLTPKECFRLQGFTDELFEKAKTVCSESQLYKQAGNAVKVIGEHLPELTKTQ